MGFGVKEAIAGGAGCATTARLQLPDATPLGLTTFTVQVRAVVPTLTRARSCVALMNADKGV